MSKEPKQKSGIPILKIKLTTKQQRRRKLLTNPEVLDLMRAAFQEGQRWGDWDQLIEHLSR
jgi:hypothetical protein